MGRETFYVTHNMYVESAVFFNYLHNNYIIKVWSSRWREFQDSSCSLMLFLTSFYRLKDSNLAVTHSASYLDSLIRTSIWFTTLSTTNVATISDCRTPVCTTLSRVINTDAQVIHMCPVWQGLLFDTLNHRRYEQKVWNTYLG